MDFKKNLIKYIGKEEDLKKKKQTYYNYNEWFI